MKLATTKLGFSILLITGCCFSIVLAQQTAAQKYLISVERIWERAQHNAFTDLVEFNGKLYCTFREASAHVPGKEGMNGTIRVSFLTMGKTGVRSRCWQKLLTICAIQNGQ